MALIDTIYGPMEERLILKGKKTGVTENDDVITHWVEYWIEGVMVHRSVSTRMKKGLKVGFIIYEE